ncbi:MAG: signal peptidase I [bacterium]|nr:signal peptidase I [bacterium]
MPPKIETNRERTTTSSAEKVPRKSVLREWTEFILTLIVMVFFIRVTTVEAFRIPTGSMEDTLLVGDFLLVNKFVYGIRTPDWIGIPFTKFGFHIPWTRLPGSRDVKSGDIIVFRYPLDRSLNYIKRCVAGPGQSVEVRGKELYVDGRLFPDPPHAKHTNPHPYPPNVRERGIFAPPGSPWNRDYYGPVTVPEGCYFVMGDNRDNSADSRYWGYLKKEDVIGKALVIYLSYNKEVPIHRFYDLIRWSRMTSMIH